MVYFGILHIERHVYAEIYLQVANKYNSVRRNTLTFASETWKDGSDQGKGKNKQ